MIRAALAFMAGTLFAAGVLSAIYVDFDTGSLVGIGGLLAIVGLIRDAGDKRGRSHE